VITVDLWLLVFQHQDLREFISRITDQRHAEQLEFEQRMSAVRKAGEMRQKEKESLEMQIQGLQQRLQELTREGVAGESELKQLEIGYNAAAEKWKRAMEKLKDQISTAIPSVVRFSIHSALIRALIDLTNIVSYLSGLAEEALAAVVQATSGRDLEFPAGFGAGRPSSSVSAQPSATLSSQARARVPLPPLSELLSGVGQERASERGLSPGTSLPTFDSLRASRDHRAPQPSLPRTGLLPRLLPRPKNHNHDNERSPNDSHGLYSCPECGQGFNRMVIMERHRARHGINPQRELSSSRSGTAGTTTSSPSP
jgi:hypothetical protein